MKKLSKQDAFTRLLKSHAIVRCCTDYKGKRHVGWELSRSWDVYSKRFVVGFESLDGKEFEVAPSSVEFTENPYGSLIVGEKMDLDANMIREADVEF